MPTLHHLWQHVIRKDAPRAITELLRSLGGTDRSVARSSVSMRAVGQQPGLPRVTRGLMRGLISRWARMALQLVPRFSSSSHFNQRKTQPCLTLALTQVAYP